MRSKRLMIGVACLLSWLTACSGADDSDALIAPAIFAPLGDPLPSLTDEQRAAFDRGRDLALRKFDPTDGLGPEFNTTFCAGCHEKPVIGGSAGHYRNFNLEGQQLPDGTTFARGKNGVQRQFSLNTGRDPSDPVSDVSAPRNPVPFFGAGLLLEIPDDEILRNQDPEDADGDGISGRAHFVDGFVGRFGRKAQTQDLEIFIRGPLFNHMGISTDPLSEDRRASLPMKLGGSMPFAPKQSVLPEEPTFDNDGAPDPEISDAELFDLVSFSMTLAAPTPGPTNDQTDRGEALFDTLECSGCHVPFLTGPRGRIPAYSDLLLHDMGPALADQYSMGDASRSEFRTQPLWGVIAVAPYLHDGRAGSLDEAIRWHGGEAAASAEAYAALTADDRNDVLAFLASLGGADQASEGLLPPDAPVPSPGAYGAPVAGLDGQEAERFARGRALFDRDVSYSEGVGPAFNGDSCRGCHFLPTIGGAGPSGVDAMRQGAVDSDGGFVLPPSGTALLRHASFDDPARPEPDDVSTVFEPRQTPAVFGLGLIEQIPRASVEALADPEDEDGDGIAGRAHVLADGRLGRFGWKANVPGVREFVRDALTNELGLTLPQEPGLTFGRSEDSDGAADPEVTVGTIDDLTFYLQQLGPPPRTRSDEDLEDRGETVFAEVGCARCHVPVLQTGAGDDVRLYSDLLLHDVAEPGALGIVDGVAGMRDFRTPPLWGIGQTAPYMHDGRAVTLEAAVEAHAGEGANARDAVSELTDADREALFAFLRSL